MCEIGFCLQKTASEKNDVKPTVGFNFSPTLWDDGGVKNKNENISRGRERRKTGDGNRGNRNFDRIYRINGNRMGVCTRPLFGRERGGFNHRERIEHIDSNCEIRERQEGRQLLNNLSRPPFGWHSTAERV